MSDSLHLGNTQPRYPTRTESAGGPPRVCLVYGKNEEQGGDPGLSYKAPTLATPARVGHPAITSIALETPQLSFSIRHLVFRHAEELVWGACTKAWRNWRSMGMPCCSCGSRPNNWVCPCPRSPS